MKAPHFLSLFYLTLIALYATGCARSVHDVWDDTRTAGRHMGRGLRSLGGKHGDSRQVCSRDEFYCGQDYSTNKNSFEFEPLPDQDYLPQISAGNASAIDPGLPNSRLPGIEAFRDPQQNPSLARIFRNIKFAYNSNLIKGDENLKIIHSIADYLKSHPNTYLFIEGHCDERGAEAYNLALGVRRSNTVKELLIKDGVEGDRIFTVSYGKEKPLDLGRTEEAWAKNRRAQFKIYDL